MKGDSQAHRRDEATSSISTRGKGREINKWRSLNLGLFLILLLLLVFWGLTLRFGLAAGVHWLYQFLMLGLAAIVGGIFVAAHFTQKNFSASQKVLAEVEAQYRKMIERSNDGVAIVQDGLIKFANKQLASMFGYEPQDIVGKKLVNLLVSQESQSDGSSNNHESYVENSTGQYEMSAVHRKGHVVSLETSTGTIVYNGRVATLTMLKDITSRVQKEEELRRQERQFRSLTDVIDTSSVGTFILDPRFHIVWMNQAIEKIFGVRREELIGRDKREVVQETFKHVFKHPEAYAERVLASYDTNTSVEVFQCHVLKKGRREERWLEQFSQPIRSGLYRGGRIEHYYDITDRKSSEQQRRVLEEQLRQSDKMQAIGQLAGGVAHDFNNQLTGIRGYAEVLRDQLNDDQMGRRFAQNIIVAVERSAELTRQLLAFARQGHRANIAVNLHEVIAEVDSMLQHVIDENIKVNMELGATWATTMGDPSQLQNALLNLALNARDAMPTGGPITFSTELADIGTDDRDSIPPGVAPGRYVCVRVADTGVGIEEEVQRHIFEPFYTTKKKGKGTGMGLAAVYGTVKGHGGFIRVDSEVGVGTTISVYFPLEIEHATSMRHSEMPGAFVTGEGHILVVDDEQVICDTTSITLSSLGYKVSTCLNGVEAVELYRERWRDIDLVLIDMVMPVMGGRETFSALQRINPEIVALLCSGYSVKGEAQDALTKGAKGFIPKPYGKNILSQRIAEALGRTTPEGHRTVWPPDALSSGER